MAKKKVLQKSTEMRTNSKPASVLGIKSSKSSHVKKTSEEAELDIEDIRALGGSKADMELLQMLQGDDQDEIEITEDLESEPIKRDDIRDFISQLGLEKYAEQPKKEVKPTKIKLASMPNLKSDDKSQPELKDQADDLANLSIPKKSKKNKYKKLSADKIQDGEVSSSTADPEISSPKHSFLDSPVTKHKQLLVKPGGRWFENEFSSDPVVWEPLSKDQMSKLESYASTLFDFEVDIYHKQQEKRKSSDAVWMRTVLSSGTSSDKMAALTVLIQESYVHTLQHLDTLINLVKKKNRREAHMALSTLQELFTSDLLPDSRKLRNFQSHPHSQIDTITSGNHIARDKRLILWMFESRLKDHYSRFLAALQDMSHDTVSATKQKAIDSFWSLLASKPEQEKLLLSSLVNKLGDPDHKLAAHTAHLLTKLVDKHPNMKQVIVLEVERLLYRSNITPKAQYYAICFLNQLVLSNKEKAVAKRLVTIYFSFFRVFVKKRDLDSKMLSGLLSGVNRAWRFAKMERDALKADMDTLYKLVPTANFNTSLQALLLLQQVSDNGDGLCERYYSTLYRAMQDPGLRSSSKQPVFLSLLLRSLRNDDSIQRVAAFVRRLLQLCLTLTPSFACGALIILSDLIKKRPALLQKNKVAEDIAQLTEDGDEDEEKFVDVDDGGIDVSDEENESSTLCNLRDESQSSKKSSWIHRSSGHESQHGNEYNPVHRNPMYAHADVCCTWELGRLVNHYHPSVSLFAQTLLKGEQITYPGDPLHDFTLIRFLDRFVYRNPKQREKSESTISRPARSNDYTPTGVRAIAVNTPEFLENDETNIPVDEKFFYKYFKQKATSEKKVDDVASDDEEVSDSEFDNYLDTFEQGLTGESGKDKWEIDFAKEMQKKKGKHDFEDSDSEDDLADMGDDDGGDDDDDDDDADGEDADLSDEEPDFELKDFENDFDDTDDWEEEAAFSDGEDEFMEISNFKKSSKRSRDDSTSRKSKKMKGDDITSLFAAAEDFSQEIEEEMNAADGGTVDMTSSEAVSVKDKASAKQIAWEAKREKEMQGKIDWRKKKQKKFEKKKGVKIPNNLKGAHKKGENRAVKSKSKIKAKNIKSNKKRKQK